MTDRRAGFPGRHGVSPRQRVAGYFLALAGGLGVNALSADVGYRGMAAAAALAAILISTNWVRQFPSTAPLIRMASWGLLGGAGIAAVIGVINPGWEGPATLVATALITTAVLLPTALDRPSLSCGGVAVIGGGAVVLRDGAVLAGVAVIGVGVAVLRGSDVLWGVAVIGVGVALVGAGVAVIGDRVLIPGGGAVLLAVMTIGGGVAIIALGIAVLCGSDVLGDVAVIGGGVTIVGVGVDFLHDGAILAGVAVIGAGVAVIGGGVIVLRGMGVFVPVVTWLESLTRAADDDRPDGESEDSTGSRARTPEPPDVK